MPISEPDTPHIPPPDFVPKKEMGCKACDIKFLNFNTWKQHKIVVHDMSIKDWATTLCRPYLRAVHFELITDSKVVAALLTNDTSSSRRQNFLLRMAEYSSTPQGRVKPQCRLL